MAYLNKINRSRNRREAFSLIELLVVIAIIALLAAIIFPVFASVRENGRQSSSISNMHDISAKMEMYKLDTGHYPPVLFGYAVPDTNGAIVPMDKALDTCTASNTCTQYLPGLYPAYINNITEFKDPNNDADYTQTAVVGTFALCTSSDPGCSGKADGELVVSGVNHSFYAADAYDISPRLSGATSLQKDNTGKYFYLPRYQTSWTSIDSNLDCAQNTGSALCASGNGNYYLDQLRWKNPPAGTYVTSVTYHVQQTGKVLVLTQNGNVQKIDSAAFFALDNAPTIGVNSGIASFNYWKITK